jgi:hypothetical protein
MGIFRFSSSLGRRKYERIYIFQHSEERKHLQTTGPKITVRFFSGFDLSSIDLNSEALVDEAYKKGVPMGQTYLLMAIKCRSL